MRALGSLFLLLATLGGAATSALAHPLAPSLLEIREEAPQRAVARWKRPLAASDAVQPVLAHRCRALDRAVERSDDVSRITAMALDCGPSLVGAEFGVDGLDRSRTDVLLRVQLLDGRVVHRVLRPGETRFVVPARQGAAEVAWSYLGLGFVHVTGGIDHLLFLFGLLVLASNLRRLVTMVTAFTAGHAVTLSLAAIGRVALPAAPVEVLIAITILALAVELAREPVSLPSLLQRRPALLTFAFGLLHGLGFAGALRDAGIPDGEAIPALLGFNGGIEAGQLAFVAAVLLLGVVASRVIPRGRSARMVAAYAIGSVAACLFFERAVLMLG